MAGRPQWGVSSPWAHPWLSPWVRASPAYASQLWAGKWVFKNN